MYEDNETRVDWKNIIKKVVIVIVAVIAILGIFTLVKKCTHTEKKPNKPEVVDLTKQLDQLEEATLKYLTKDNLPSTLNSSKTIRLKILTNKGLLTGITDDAKNTCDTSESYAEITRLDNNYAIKLSLTCGPNSDYRIIYVGCFENCNDGICKGDENSTNGICELTPNQDPTPEDNKPNQSTNTNNNSKPSNTNTNKPSTSKPGNNNNNSNNSNNNNSSSNNNNNPSNNNNTIKYVTEYEYRKAIQENVCPDGKKPVNNMCIVTVNETLYGKVIEKGGTNIIVLGNATPKTSTTGGSTTNAKLVDTIYTSKPSTIKDTSTIGYKAKGISAKGEYIFDKYSCASGTIKNVNGTFKCTTAGTTKTTYTCSVGDPKEINGVYKCVKTENTPKTKGCEDPYFTYNSWNNTCTKNVVSTKQIRPNVSTKYQYTWSRSTFVDGWTKTGKTRTVRE